MLRQGVELDLALVEHKLAIYDRTWNREALDEAMERVRAGWERDLRHLLPQFVSYDVARERVEALLA